MTDKMVMHHIIQTLFLLAGLTALLAAIFNWKWLFESENAAPVVKFLGRKGCRYFYGIIGVLLIVAAICFWYKISKY